MAIYAACECGKRFKIDDNYSGRRGVCPACHAELWVPEIDVWVPVEPKQSWRRPVAVKRRTIILVAIAVLAALVGVPAYLATARAKDPPGMKAARTFVEAILAGVVDEKYQGFTLDHTIVDRVEEDPRKLPWLWLARSLLVPRGSKPGGPDDIGWDLVFQFNPLTGQGQAVSLMTGPIGGESARATLGSSEWKPEFQEKVVRAWELAYADYIDRRGPHEMPISHAAQQELQLDGRTRRSQSGHQIL